MENELCDFMLLFISRCYIIILVHFHLELVENSDRFVELSHISDHAFLPAMTPCCDWFSILTVHGGIKTIESVLYLERGIYPTQTPILIE